MNRHMVGLFTKNWGFQVTETWRKELKDVCDDVIEANKRIKDEKRARSESSLWIVDWPRLGRVTAVEAITETLPFGLQSVCRNLFRRHCCHRYPRRDLASLILSRSSLPEQTSPESAVIKCQTGALFRSRMVRTSRNLLTVNCNRRDPFHCLPMASRCKQLGAGDKV